jgi:hypothetical protein
MSINTAGERLKGAHGPCTEKKTRVNRRLLVRISRREVVFGDPPSRGRSTSYLSAYKMCTFEAPLVVLLTERLVHWALTGK